MWGHRAARQFDPPAGTMIDAAEMLPVVQDGLRQIRQPSMSHEAQEKIEVFNVTKLLSIGTRRNDRGPAKHDRRMNERAAIAGEELTYDSFMIGRELRTKERTRFGIGKNHRATYRDTFRMGAEVRDLRSKSRPIMKES